MTPPHSEHRLAEHRFARRRVADDGEVPDICRLIGFHKSESHIEFLPQTAGETVFGRGNANNLKKLVP